MMCACSMILGVAWHAGLIYIADTYNSKIKVLDPHGPQRQHPHR